MRGYRYMDLFLQRITRRICLLVESHKDAQHILQMHLNLTAGVSMHAYVHVNLFFTDIPCICACDK